MKLLQIGSFLHHWGGLEIFLLNYCSALQTRGHEVVLTCPAESFVDTEARARGIRTVAISARRRSDWSTFSPYLKLLSEERFDVLHTHSHYDTLVAPIAGFLRRVPKRVMTFYSPASNDMGRFSSFFYHHVVTDIVAVSEALRQKHIAEGVPANKFHMIHNCIDAKSLQNAVVPERVESLRQQWGTPLVGFAGRIVPEKGWTDFIEAMALVPEARGVLIGDGTDAEKAATRIKELGLQGRVTLAGFTKDIPNALSALDIHVLPSVYEEPCATVVLQAMALGRPVIGTTLGGTPEMIEDGKTGLLVSPNAPQEMANAIRTLLADPTKCKEIGNAGRKRVETVFGMETMVETMERRYATRIST
jgi:glycosyltransferase involved in cell wall biosynthesis